MIRRSWATISMLVLFIVILSSALGCSSSTRDSSQVSTTSAQIVTCPTASFEAVAITSSPAFSPSSVTITVNDIVKWTNNDSTSMHTVTSGAPGATDGKFDSGNITTGSTVCVQFLVKGTFDYFCNIHTFMTGAVIVQ
jgi:plastocyanin